MLWHVWHYGVIKRCCLLFSLQKDTRYLTDRSSGCSWGKWQQRYPKKSWRSYGKPSRKWVSVRPVGPVWGSWISACGMLPMTLEEYPPSFLLVIYKTHDFVVYVCIDENGDIAACKMRKFASLKFLNARVSSQVIDVICPSLSIVFPQSNIWTFHLTSWIFFGFSRCLTLEMSSRSSLAKPPHTFVFPELKRS